MIAVIKKRDGVGPLIFGEGAEAADVGVPFAVGEKTQHVGDLQGVVELAVLHVGLAENGERGAVLGVEQAFHGGEGYRLVLGDQLALHVAGGESCNSAATTPTRTPAFTNVRP